MVIGQHTLKAIQIRVAYPANVLTVYYVDCRNVAQHVLECVSETDLTCSAQNPYSDLGFYAQTMLSPECDWLADSLKRILYNAGWFTQQHSIRYESHRLTHCWSDSLARFKPVFPTDLEYQLQWTQTGCNKFVSS